MNPPTNTPTNTPTNRPIDRANNMATSKPLNPAIDKPINEPANQQADMPDHVTENQPAHEPSGQPMSDHRTRFLQLALRAQALRFGEFTLKSGRSSPYFFNAGRFDSGAVLAELAGCYADAIDAHVVAGTGAGLEFDLLFGPAYKGIPLATALACEYAGRGRDLPLAFNRKEAKAHGEGGSLIGAPLAGRRVLIVDDVITAGTAIREALGIIAAAGGRVAGIVIALDRQEVAGGAEITATATTTRRSAAETVAHEHALPVIAIASLEDLLGFADQHPDLADLRGRLLAYRDAYGCGASL